MTRIRAIICDVYRTLLEIGEPSPNAEIRWQERSGIHVSLVEISRRCRLIVAEDHAAARLSGVKFPEVLWPTVLARAVPDLAGSLDEDLVFAHMQLLRPVWLMPGADQFLDRARRHGLALGIASNAQAYTLRELDAVGVDRTIFDPALVAWSFELGFSKPNPHLFRLLTTRLAFRGIAPGEILMVGDRHDNDIIPAKAQGWQTWQFGAGSDGDWADLRTAFGW